jgi:hypothetical protein
MTNTGKVDAKKRRVFKDAKDRTYVKQGDKKVYVKKLFTPKANIIAKSPTMDKKINVRDFAKIWKNKANARLKPSSNVKDYVNTMKMQALRFNASQGDGNKLQREEKTIEFPMKFKKGKAVDSRSILALRKNNINIETSRSKPSVPTQNNPVKKQKQLKEESSDEEVYVVQSKKKKNVKKRIILESSDDDESSDDEQVQINRQPTYRDTNNFFV